MRFSISRFALAFALVLGLSVPAWAAPAYDAFSNSSAATSPSWTHTPVGTPRAVMVWLVQLSGTDDTSGCTYGGVSMTEVTGSPNLKSTGEIGGVYTYFLGASVPTGAQTVTCTGTSNTKIGWAVTITGAADMEIVDADATIQADSQADPSVTLSLTGRSSFAVLGFFSGQNAVTSVTPLTNWTGRYEGTDGGSTWGSYTYDIIGTSDVTAGWTQTADDAVMIALAVAEVGGASPTPKRLTLLGVGAWA